MKPFDPQKFVEGVLYFAAHTDPETLGITKLNKLFYFADRLHLNRYGTFIFGGSYRKLEQGPVPEPGYAVLGKKDDLPQQAGAFDILKRGFFRYSQSQIKPRRKPDIKYFSESELECLKEVCNQFSRSTAAELCDLSHKDPAWQATEMFGEIDPFFMVDPGNKHMKKYVKYWLEEEEALRTTIGA